MKFSRGWLFRHGMGQTSFHEKDQRMRKDGSLPLYRAERPGRRYHCSMMNNFKKNSINHEQRAGLHEDGGGAFSWPRARECQMLAAVRNSAASVWPCLCGGGWPGRGFYAAPQRHLWKDLAPGPPGGPGRGRSQAY